MKKILWLLFVALNMSLFADNVNYTNNIDSAPQMLSNNISKYKNFQDFDNQVSIGFSLSQTMLSNGIQNQVIQQDQATNLDVEHQFDNGVWADIGAYMMMATNSLGNQSTGTGMGYGMPATQEAGIGGFNIKTGYSFPLGLSTPHQFLITPYGTVGRNTNLSMSTILSNGQINVTNDYFITAGLGVRAQYIINKYVDLYVDQSWVYNWDQSGPLYGIMPQNDQIFTTTVGGKYNVWKQLQLGLGLFYNNYQYNAVAPNSTTVNGGNAPNAGTVSIYQPQYNVGVNLSLGMTF